MVRALPIHKQPSPADSWKSCIFPQINSMITYKWTHTRGVTLCWSFGVWASARAIVRAHRFISDRDYSGEMHSSL